MNLLYLRLEKHAFVLPLILICSIPGLLFCSCSPRPVHTHPSPSTKPARPYKVLGKWYHPLSSADNFQQEGLASWYGTKFHGQKTANGEIYDMHAMTAAHKTLPLGTWVQVTNTRNNKVVVVRVNDRGPFVGSRVIDLSYKAAKKLDIVGPGTAPVRIVALGASQDSSRSAAPPQKFLPVDYDSGSFTFQVGAFKNRRNARNLVQQLSRNYTNAHIATHDTGQETFYRVRVGKYTSLRQIMQAEEKLKQDGFPGAFIVAE